MAYKKAEHFQQSPSEKIINRHHSWEDLDTGIIWQRLYSSYYTHATWSEGQQIWSECKDGSSQ